MASYSCSFPQYVDAEKKERLELDCFDGKITKDVYYAEVEELTTPKNKLMDLGSGLAVFWNCQQKGSLFIILPPILLCYC